MSGGSIKAMYELGQCYVDGEGVVQDDRLAFEWLQKSAAAAEPHPLANSELGRYYAHGKGTAPDHTEALRLLRPAAEAGNARAMMCQLGHMYQMRKLLVEKSDEEAARWWLLGAEAGEPQCQYIMGINLYTGEGVPQSTEEAMRWWRAAATQGDVVSMYYLALAGLHDGHGDREEALEWLRTAAAKGHEGAREALQRL